MHLAIILKIVERCNLDCQYCYMYHSSDQSWRARPAIISEPKLDLLANRMKEYIDTTPDGELTLEIHGGEPLLVGKKRLNHFLNHVCTAIDKSKLHVVLQTNATLLDQEWLDIFQRYGVCFAISCDGPPEIHDVFRKFRNGNASGKVVEDGIRLSLDPSIADLFGGVLCVANPSTSGAEMVRYFYNIGVRWLDFLLPDGNYIKPPTHLPNYSPAMMIQFMREAFDEWIKISDPQFTIRTFREIILGIFGQRSSLDAFGGDLSSIMVIESDGSYQLLDVLRICGDDAVNTKLDLRNHSFREYLDFSQSAFPEPCVKCIQCSAFRECGGGYLPHRFDGISYNNPSFYCPVLFDLWKHIKGHVISVTPAELWRRS